MITTINEFRKVFEQNDTNTLIDFIQHKLKKHDKYYFSKGACGVFVTTLLKKFPNLKVFGIVDYKYDLRSKRKGATIQHYLLYDGKTYFDSTGILGFSEKDVLNHFITIYNNFDFKEDIEKDFKIKEIDKMTGLPNGTNENDFDDLPEYGGADKVLLQQLNFL